MDAVHVSFGFSPLLDLSRALGCAEVPHPSRLAAAVACDAGQATSVPGVFAVGEVTGTNGAEAAELAGHLAGTSAARYLGRLDPAGYEERTGPVRTRLEYARCLSAQLDDVQAFETAGSLSAGMGAYSEDRGSGEFLNAGRHVSVVRRSR